jgi:GDPmannose 4,6-dehydratase
MKSLIRKRQESLHTKELSDKNPDRKIALITGITGQDGALLAEFLIEKNYIVHGVKRRSSVSNLERIAHLLCEKRKDTQETLILHDGDMTDTSCLTRLIGEIKPHEIYNLAAQSHVGVSFEEPEYTADVDALGPLRILEAIRLHGLTHQTRFYQASSSELFGKVQEIPQNEKTQFYPRSPYAAAKLYAYWITTVYRESYGIYACNGILFNHESAQRGEDFVTRKITRGLARIAVGLQDCLYLGNLNAKRDWGHARDYIEMQWLMLQQDHPDDYVIATGIQHSVRDFVDQAAKDIGLSLTWHGSGSSEFATVNSINTHKSKEKLLLEPGQIVVKVEPQLYRPGEVETLLGDPGKAEKELQWKPKISFEELVSEMTQTDLLIAKNAVMKSKSAFLSPLTH